MKRYIGLDLGTKTLGIAITDKSNTIIYPYELIRFEQENYEEAFKKLKEIVLKENITDIAIGLPKNMDGSEGFAAQRTYHFCSLLKELNLPIYLVDERLTSRLAAKRLLANGISSKKGKDYVDMQAATIILEDYLRGLNG